MDCGPAALKSLLEGFGRSVSYGRLREACQTDVDGTSIDTLEELAVQLGLDAEQVMLPVDHLLVPEAGALPAIVVVRTALGLTHFVVVWRTLAGLVQVMDPATGRRWPTVEAFRRDVWVHETTVPADAWREFAGSDEFLNLLRARMRRIGVEGVTTKLVDAALSDPSFRGLARLDACVRLLDALVESGGVRRGGEACTVLEDLVHRLARAPGEAEDLVPPAYWSARAAPASGESGGEDETEQVRLRGAVLIKVRGPRGAGATGESMPAPLSAELARALEEAPARPLRELLRAVREDGLLPPVAIAIGIAVAAVGTVLEAVLFRGIFDLGRYVGVTDKRLAAIAALLVFLVVLLLLELPLAASALRVGRRLEARFRLAFLRKIPRLADRYFQSRPISDMADRSHNVHTLRGLPSFGAQLSRALFLLVFTTAGVAWLDPRSGPWAALVAILSVALPFSLQRSLNERDLRVRSHSGALGRIYLDALVGLVALRAHGAQAALRSEHEGLLVEWIHASRARDRLAMVVEALQSAFAFGLTGWLFFSYYARAGEPGAALLLLYWAVNLPAHGQALALALRNIPPQRNVALRLVEPLGAMEEEDAGERPTASAVAPADGVAVRFEDVLVKAGGHTILEDVSLAVAPGEQVAIVGASGAGKSSLVGLLLGWHKPAAGKVLVDGEPLGGAALDAVRASTAWLDPAVQIWNRSLLDNLVYGAPAGSEGAVGEIVEHAELASVLETLPDGMATSLGEGGGLVSGGEGQRVRFGRASLRRDARLVILDEPFRGLDRERRRALLARARQWWKRATFLCITHDVGETRDFERVIVVDQGRIIEDGPGRELAADPASRYGAMLRAEAELQHGAWTSTDWHRIQLRGGVIHEGAEP
jgi:ATP-binding cassette subfamily B protein